MLVAGGPSVAGAVSVAAGDVLAWPLAVGEALPDAVDVPVPDGETLAVGVPSLAVGEAAVAEGVPETVAGADDADGEATVGDAEVCGGGA